MCSVRYPLKWLDGGKLNKRHSCSKIKNKNKRHYVHVEPDSGSHRGVPTNNYSCAFDTVSEVIFLPYIYGHFPFCWPLLTTTARNEWCKSDVPICMLNWFLPPYSVVAP
jgi:hypothetical protein